MSRMLCKCGATMGTSVSPSPYSLYIYYEQEVDSAIAENPDIHLADFLTDWDAVGGTQKMFMKRPELVEYWRCTECHRIYETQMHIGGRWLRVYQRAGQQQVNMSYEGWTRIYILTDIETDKALEDNPQMLLSEYLKTQERFQYLLSPDDATVVALAVMDGSVRYIYTQEKSE